MTEAGAGDGTRTVRVLSIDGGGMRGYYTAVYLDALARRYAAKRDVSGLDVGAGFDLITGTSTGAIIGCALAAGTPLPQVADLYRTQGGEIFPLKLPRGFGLNFLYQLWRRPKSLEAGAAALERTLTETLGEETIGGVWERRGIGLAIPAIEMARHHAWVFKTPHLRTSMHRDDGYRLVDVCMASSAAPIFRSMAPVPHPDTGGDQVFVDGGLWANNPVLVGLIDALGLTGPGDRVEVYCLGTCPRPEGERIDRADVHRGLSGWRFGGEAVSLAMSAQEYAYHHMARMIAGHVERDCRIVWFPQGKVPAQVMKYLDMDETSTDGMNALRDQAQKDVSETLSQRCSNEEANGRLLDALMWELPAAPENPGW